MGKYDDSTPMGQKCSTTARHLREIAHFRRRLKAEMRVAEKRLKREPEEAEGSGVVMVKLLPLYLKLVSLEQELLDKQRGRKDGQRNGGEAMGKLTDEDWEILAQAVKSRKNSGDDGS